MIPQCDATVPYPYKVLHVERTQAGITLSICEDGIEEPNAEIVLIWRDKDDILWVHWDGRDHRAIEWKTSSMDFTNPDNEETQVLIDNNKTWRDNATA